jgi:hypothetical protein
MSEHTQLSADEYFQVESHLLSTRSADAFAAQDRSRGSRITLWLMRHPFALNSEGVKRFLKRQQVISSLEPKAADMLGYGVDNQGTAFAVFPPLDGYVIVAGNIESAEAERRFMACLNLISRFHQEDIVCGDICGSSFWVDRTGDLSFIGVMGSFDTEATATAMLPPMETLHFMAPEQKGGGGAEAASDVYALGVLGYYLLCRRFPFGEGMLALAQASPAQRPSEVLSNPPIWADEVLMRCLERDPANRYANAMEVVLALRQVRERAFEAHNVPVARTRSVPKPEENLERSLTEQFQGGAPASLTPLHSDDSQSRSRKVRIGVVVLISVALGVAIMGGILVKGRFTTKEEALLEPHTLIASGDLKQALEGLSAPDLALAARQSYLEQISASDDPMAQDILLTLAKDAQSEALRRLSERSILERARRLGMYRGVDVVKVWLEGLVFQEPLPVIYKAVIKALDHTLPAEARSGSLREVYAGNPRLGLSLAAASALDSEQLESLQIVLGQLVGDALRIEDAESRSSLALILAVPELTALYGDDVIQRRDQIADKDVLWVLGVLAERNDSNVRAIAALALERGLVPAKRRIFLSIVRDRDDIPVPTLQALVRAAAGLIRVEDIGIFGRWYDVSVEKILYAICSDKLSEEVLLEAFDTLASRSLIIMPSSQLVEAVRSRYWERRREFIYIVGILGNIELASDEELKGALQLLDPFTRDRSLVETLADAGIPRLTRLTVERYQDLMGAVRLINLLSSTDRDLKLSAIKALTKHNDVGALKMIIEAYERESDPLVKKAYEESFWVVRQRLSGNQAQPGQGGF